MAEAELFPDLNESQIIHSLFGPMYMLAVPNPVERYGQYNVMDNDSEVQCGFGYPAEFCSKQTPESTNFNLHFNNKATNSESKVLQNYLLQWSKLQKFDTKMFPYYVTFSKYGDAFLVRDPETKRWFLLIRKSSYSIVNESKAKSLNNTLLKILILTLEMLLQQILHYQVM